MSFRAMRGDLTDFGSSAAGKHVMKAGVLLEGTTDGVVWTTIPGPDDEYKVYKREGMVEQCLADDSGALVDWDDYFVWQDAGNQAFRVTYKVNDNGTKTTYTQRPITFVEVDEASNSGGGQVNVLVETEDIGNESVTGTNIANATITATNIANATITAAQIANATITAAQIANATITATQIANATITGSNIASATITGPNIANATITGGNIANGTITGGNIATGTIQSGNIAAGAIVAGNIANLTITSAQIANLTITASQISNYTLELRTFTQAMIDALSNADARNQVYNNGFENGGTFWLSGGAGTIGAQTNASNAHGGNKYLEITMDGFYCRATQSDETGATRYYEVKPGQVVRGSAWAYRVSGDHYIWVGVETFDANKSHVAWNVSPNVVSTGVWTQTSIEVTIPAGVKYVTFYVEVQNGTTTTTARFDDAEMFILLPGLDIVANSITANQIAANTITATQIAANTITATQIAAGTITADRIGVSSLAAINANIGAAAISDVLSIGSSGGIWQGSSGSFGSPSTGWKLYNSSGNGVMEWWNSGYKVVEITKDRIVLDYQSVTAPPYQIRLKHSAAEGTRVADLFMDNTSEGIGVFHVKVNGVDYQFIGGGASGLSLPSGADLYLPSGGKAFVNGIRVLENRKTGWGAPTGTATRSAFETSTVTLEQLAQRVKALIDDLRAHGLIND